MNDQKIDGILSQARAALEPTDEDRRRVHKKVIAAVGAAGVATAIATTAGKASASGAGGLWGMIVGSSTVVKIGIATLLFGGVAGIATVVGMDSSEEVAVVVSSEKEKGIGKLGEQGPSPVAESQIPAKQPVEKDVASSAHSVESKRIERTEVEISKETSTGKASIQKKRVSRNREVNAEQNKIENDDLLLREIALIRKASSALRQNRPDAAMQVIQVYDREIKDGAMGEERDGLRVLTLCAMGRKAEAQRARKRFLKKAPGSPLAARIKERCRELLGD